MKIKRIFKRDKQICIACNAEPEDLYYYSGDDEDDGMCAECMIEDLVDNSHEVDC